MPRDKTSSVEPETPTKTITASDGTQLHYPYLPNVGEKYQPPDAATREGHRQATAQTPSSTVPTASPSPVSAESWHDRITSAARSVVERAGTYGQAAVQALVLDDWHALTDTQSTPLQRVMGGANLASWVIPEGKVVEIAGHALAKVAEQAAAHLATAGMEHAAEHVTATAAVNARWAARSENAKIAEQHAMNPSKIWDRPLTDAERHGAFQDKHDLTAFLGPATVKGGPKREWHHLVESNTESRFGRERVHNVDNVGAIEKDPIHKGISKASQSIDPELGLGADGKERSLRDFLKDKSWDRHVDEGERLLRQKGIDPERDFRAETRKRFEKRVELHDRLHGRAAEQAAPKLTVPSAPSLVSQDEHLLRSDRLADSPPRDLRATPRTPDTFRHEASSLSVERDGHATAVSPGYRQQGVIQSTDGDRIVQDIGRGHTATYSRKELEAQFSDSKAFDAMMQPGNYVNVGVKHDGVIDVQQQVPGYGWKSLGNQPLSHVQQSSSPDRSLGH